MTYRKRYEDSYLDDEDEEIDGDERTDAERIVALLEKPDRTPKEDARITKLLERLYVGAKLPGPPGENAIYGIEVVAGAYAALGAPDTATGLWERLGDVAGNIGRSDLYYKAMDAIAALSQATYEEYHPGETMQADETTL
jgi:hypothetical protein